MSEYRAQYLTGTRSARSRVCYIVWTVWYQSHSTRLASTLSFQSDNDEIMLLHFFQLSTLEQSAFFLVTVLCGAEAATTLPA